MGDTDADLDAILAMLEGAGLVEEYLAEDGHPAMRLTKDGVQLARAMAMSGDDARAALNLMLDAVEDGTSEPEPNRPAPDD